MLTRDDNHVYRWNGEIKPGVTTIIRDLKDFGGAPEAAIAFAGERGRAVHAATVFIDRKTLDEDTVDARVWPYLDAYMEFLAKHQTVWVGIEQMLYHGTFGYAGEFDRAGLLDGEYALIDIKTCEPHPIFGVQTAAYRELLAFDPAWGDVYRQCRRFTLHLRNDGTFRLREYKDINDLPVFLSCLTVYNWRLRHAQ